MRTQGTALECFEDLMERIEPDLLEKRKVLAQALGVEDVTVKRWAANSGNPVGLSVISLRYYLDFLGYRVDELVSISALLQDAGRLLAFRVITTDEMAGLTGFDEYPDALISILRGARGISASREEKLGEVVATYRKELLEKMRTTPKLIQIDRGTSAARTTIGSSNDPVSTLTKPVVVPMTGLKVGTKREERFRGLALNLLDFARFYTDPEVPEEVRDQLRSVVGQQNIFDLKNLLARLCSSKAFSNQQ